MRLPLDSPFSPGSDTIPQVWAGRTQYLTDWRDVVRPRRLAGLAERGRTIVGEPGSGKSSLVRRIAAEATSVGDWATPQLRIPSGTDPLKRVATALVDLAATAGLGAGQDRRIGSILRRVEKVAVSGVAVSLASGDGPEPYMDLRDLLVEIGRAALRAGDVMVLIHIDEVQNITDGHARSQLLVALGDALVHEERVIAPGGMAIDRALPLAVYLTGLPEFADLASARTGATFTRRFETNVLDAISADDLTLALQPFLTEGWPVAGDTGDHAKVFMEPHAQRTIVDVSRGEPFLFQLAGERAWYAGSGDTITADDVLRGWQGAAPQAEAHVQRILDRLPGREVEFLHAMANLDPEQRLLSQIADQAGFAKASDAGPTAQRLDITRGIIRRGKPYTFHHRAIEAFLTSDWPAPAAATPS